MARPTTREERRSESLNIRVTPSLKEKLEARARIGGRKLSAEIEERLVQSMADSDAPTSPETRDLLNDIQRLIGEIEGYSKSKWHEGIGTWAAIAEMLATGPIMQRVPSQIKEQDSRLVELFDMLFHNREQRDSLIQVISFAGLNTLTNAGWLQFAPATGNRDDLRTLADERLPDHLKENALKVIDDLEALDESDRQISEEIDQIIEPFREAIEEGRKRYPKQPLGLVLKSALNRLNPPTNALLPFAPQPPRGSGGPLQNAGRSFGQADTASMMAALERRFAPAKPDAAE